MESFLPNKRVYDSIRKKWVAATAEEVVRQKVLLCLIKDLGYPPGGIVVEKALSELPHLEKKKVPLRRLDILCYQMGVLRPLLLIECKSGSLHPEMLPQIMGYNALIGAPLVCLVGVREWIFKWSDPKRAMAFHRLPSYETLCYETRLSKSS